MFLDVTSSHKNTLGNTDVLPFRARQTIEVKEKVASLILKVDSQRVGNESEIKFTPEEASYGLLFDATSSTPTSGAKFTNTSWDFGNGVKRSYKGSPKIERVQFARQGEYNVILTLRTNEGKEVKKEFLIIVRDPIAKIDITKQDGYIGDSFTFNAKNSGTTRDLSYNWEIIDINKDTVIYQKSDRTFSYSFSDKGKYNIKLKVRQSSGEVDLDSRIIDIVSQAPIAEFETKKPYSHKPNVVFFDASRSFDPDLSDDGKLKYTWYIN